MNQAPAEPRPASTPSAASGPAAVLRQLSWTVAELIIGGALLAARFLIPAQHDLLRSVTIGGAIGSLAVVFLTARFCYEVRAGRVTVQDIRAQAEYDGYYYNQFLVVNDCLHRYRHAANWTFFFDVDEYLYLPNGSHCAYYDDQDAYFAGLLKFLVVDSRPC